MRPLQALAPDQRAILELLLREDRSYAELAEMLDLPEAEVRDRAHAALAALAPDRPAPIGEDGVVADWILGRQEPAEAARTSAAVARMPAWHAWAMEVTDRLVGVDGADAPAVPAAQEDDAPAPAAPRNGRAPAQTGSRRPRPIRDAAAPTGPAETAPATGVRLPASRLGGALLIGVLALLVAGGLFLIFSGGDEAERTAADAAATATPSATPQVVNEIALRGAGTEARGLMRVFRRAEDGRLVFALAAENLAANRPREVYAVWFTKAGAAPRNLGFSQTQVGNEGVFTTGGPQQGQEAEFAKWLADYDTIVVARAAAQSASASKPGAIVLRGTLPGGQE